MSTKVKILLFVLIVFVITFFIGGPSALSGLLYFLAYISIFAVIMGFGAASGDGGVLLICAIVFGGVCLGGATILDSYADEQADDKAYEELMKESYSTNFNKDNRLLHKMLQFAETTKKQSQAAAIRKRVEVLSDSLYNVAKNAETISVWRAFQKNVPTDYHKDSSERLEELINLEWNTDSKGWTKANDINTISSFEKYLSLYPQGKHAVEAEKRIVDIGISKVYSGEYGQLPTMDRVHEGKGSKSQIRVSNNTDYTLTLLYSGNDSRRLNIQPHGSANISLRNGIYKIAAYVSASNVRSFAGTETLQGGGYSVTYYITQY